MSESKKLSTDSYKGVRDFYPEDMYIQKYLFDTMRKAVERFGYVEYGASILEPTELYKGKSSEEIVNEQTYSFKDRGDRDVTLRPEMTPTVARMVAAKKRELAYPLRWYSIPNLFRYEKPQRGRLREHFQLNVDLFGVDTIEAEKEVITVASSIMRSFGAKDIDFEIRINSRKLLQSEIEKKLTDKTNYSKAIRLIDKKDKLSPKAFADAWVELSSTPFSLDIQESAEIKDLLASLKGQGITNAVFDPTLARGFDYYTGIVFEIYDTNKENPRSLFGGGRYDDLLGIFGNDRVPAVGFGMGDVTLQDFLKVRGLLPAYKPSATLYIARAEGAEQKDIDVFARNLREQGINVVVDITGKKVSDQLKKASKDAIPYVIVVGGEELKSGMYKLKNMSSSKETPVTKDSLAHELRRI